MDAVRMIMEAMCRCEHGNITACECTKILAPLHDVESVVRCKDCKHGEPGACGDGVDCDGAWHDDNWFCAYGERKEGR